MSKWNKKKYNGSELPKSKRSQDQIKNGSEQMKPYNQMQAQASQVIFFPAASNHRCKYEKNTWFGKFKFNAQPPFLQPDSLSHVTHSIYVCVMFPHTVLICVWAHDMYLHSFIRTKPPTPFLCAKTLDFRSEQTQIAADRGSADAGPKEEDQRAAEPEPASATPFRGLILRRL